MISPQPAFLQDDPFPGIQQSSSWSTVASNSTHNRNTSNNPYRQRRDLRPEHSPATGVRKKTPVRAVFNDLPTAHSSITSGKNLKSNGTGLDASNDSFEDDSIQLRELAASKRPVDFRSNLPLPPLPAIISGGPLLEDDQRILSTQESTHGSQRSQTVHPPALVRSNSIFTSIKNVLLSVSSPSMKDERSVEPSLSNWPVDSGDLKENTKQMNAGTTEVVLVYDQQHRPSASAAAKWHVRNGEHGSAHSQQLGDPSSVYDIPFEYDVTRSEPLKLDNTSHSNQIRGNSRASIDGASLDFSLPPPPNPARSPDPSKYRGVSNYSLPEGSTVGNIYKHYVGSDGPDQGSDDNLGSDEDEYAEPSLPKLYDHSPNGFTREGYVLNASSSSVPPDVLLPSALLVRKQRKASKNMVESHGLPPKFTLPDVPKIPAKHLVLSSSQGVEQSSSYEDTRRLLGITQPNINSQGLSSGFENQRDIKYEYASSQNRLQPSQPQLQSVNPFQSGLSPKVVISPADDNLIVCDDDAENYAIAERTPLEREVSEALRRASGFSAYSNGSIPSSILEHYANMSVASTSKSIGILRRQKIEDTPPSDSESLGDHTRALAEQAKAFYNQGAIASNWLTTRQQNIVRVPINHNGSMPDSPPDSPPRTTPALNGQRQPTVDDDHNDWETVGESGFGHDAKSSKELGLLGGTANRAGSSLANTSDEGTISTHIPEIEDFGSTERIAQHPGHVRYFGDYRQRDLKKTNIPVFLPVFREHKVNGYLADSTRVRPPPPPFNIAAPRLRAHSNPFQSTPPEVKPSVRAVRPSGAPPPPAPRHRFQPSLDTLNTESEAREEKMEAKVKHARHRTFDWMEDFGEPGPAVRLGLGSPDTNRPSSWQHVMGLASESDIAGMGKSSSDMNTETPKSGRLRSKLRSVTKFYGRSQNDGLAEKNSNSSRSMTNKKIRSRVQMVKGPPGAFYEGLRSKTTQHRARNGQRDQSRNISGRQTGIREYPTNTLRPLSLLKDTRPSTPATPTDRRPSEDVFANDFVYRSPLAPPSRDSWKKLYSRQQLRGMQDAAEADGFGKTRIDAVTESLKGVLNEGGSRKHLFETPTLRLWKRDDSTRTDLTHIKTNVSIVVLSLCGLFPPMLILYALGALDGIMTWWTNGQYMTFAKKQKRWAYILMISWGVAIFLGVVAFLIYWFAALRSS